MYLQFTDMSVKRLNICMHHGCRHTNGVTNAIDFQWLAENEHQLDLAIHVFDDFYVISLFH